MKLVEALDTAGGHVLVALFVFLTGVALVVTGFDLGKEITIGALGSLWTAIRLTERKS